MCERVVPLQVPGVLQPSLGTFSGFEEPCSPSQPVNLKQTARINKGYVSVSRHKQQEELREQFSFIFGEFPHSSHTVLAVNL